MNSDLMIYKLLQQMRIKKKWFLMNITQFLLMVLLKYFH